MNTLILRFYKKSFMYLLTLFIIIFATTIALGSFILKDFLFLQEENQNLSTTSYPKLSDELKNQLSEPTFQTLLFDKANNPFDDQGTGLSTFQNGIQNSTLNTTKFAPIPIKTSGLENNLSANSPKLNNKTLPVGNLNPSNLNQSATAPVFHPKPTATALVLDEKDETVKRFRNQQKRKLNGDMTKDEEVYSSDDLQPIGGDGNKQKREILFYSPTTKQYISAPIGGKFRDGQIIGVSDSDGVIFKKNNQSEIKMKWTRPNNRNEVDDAIIASPTPYKNKN